MCDSLSWPETQIRSRTSEAGGIVLMNILLYVQHHEKDIFFKARYPSEMGLRDRKMANSKNSIVSWSVSRV